MSFAGKHVIVWLLTVCLLASAAVVGVPAAAEELPPLAASAFEAANSYLSYDQYTSLGFNLGSAASADRQSGTDPLEAYASQGYTLKEVKYGWSNPQVVAVMLSSPYWDELDYGADMTAAGSTSFSISTGVETSEGAATNVGLGLSIAASVSAKVFGNGGEIGAELAGMLSKATEVQSTKAQNKTLEFQAGAGDDHVALVVFPMASYKYAYKNSSGETEYLCVNMQLEPVSTVTTLTNYNNVVREYNMDQTSEAGMLPVMDMYYISPNYDAGDPSTYFASKADFPDCLLFENGKLMASETNSALAADQLIGEVYAADTAYNVTIGHADTGVDMSLELAASESKSQQIGVSLNASVYGEITEGGDIGVAEASASQRLTLSAELGVSFSHATLNTKSVAYTIGFVDLPASAQTGVTGMGAAKSDYAFNGRLAVWTPKTCGDNVSIAPTIISALVEFTDTEAMPLYLPDDIHVHSVSDTTAILSWTNPDFSVYPFNKRRPAKYEIAAVASGSGGNVYTTVATIESVDQSYNITGLLPDKEYTYALRATDGNGRYSAYSPPVSVTTTVTDPPVILQNPIDTAVSLGEQPLFHVQARATSANYTLSYQWYELKSTRYGNTWEIVYGATEPTFNAAYFEADGTVDAANRYMLNNNLYRCVVVENRVDTFVSVASEAARLQVVDQYVIHNYNELREVALSIRNGRKEVATYSYVLANDITCPAGETWDVPIGSGSVPFSGTFDGQGHTISGLAADVTSVSPFGLFAALKGATVQNLHLKDVKFASDCANTGAICGQADNSTIRNCTVRGSVTGSAGEGGYSAGGICGYTTSSALIEKCMNYCSVSGQLDAVGGIVGRNYGTIRNCANQGTLKVLCPYFDHMPTRAYCGGVAGYNSGTVDSCYNTGGVSSNNTTYGKTAPITNGTGAANSYYLNSITNSGGGRVADQFASGEVAYALNGGLADGTQVWYQSLDNGQTPDAYPHLTAGESMTVYALDNGGYSNYPSVQSPLPPLGDDLTTTTAIATTTTSNTTVTTTAQTPDAPKTGEEHYTWVWCLIMAAAAVVILLMVSRRPVRDE